MSFHLAERDPNRAEGQVGEVRAQPRALVALLVNREAVANLPSPCYCMLELGPLRPVPRGLVPGSIRLVHDEACVGVGLHRPSIPVAGRAFLLTGSSRAGHYTAQCAV